MNRRPLLACSVAAAALVLCSAGTAAGATSATTAAGKATTAVTLLNVKAGGHTLSVGDLALLSDTTTGSPVAQVVVTPVTADGTAYGQQTVTPASSPVSVPSQSSPSALAAIVSATTPSFSTTASSSPSTHAGASSLGSLSVLGINVPLSGAVDLGSAVSSTTGAVGQKTVTVKNLSLPSIADLLAALGLDLSALPVETVNNLVNELEIVTTAVATAQDAVDTAQDQVDAATADVATKTAALAADQSTLTTATSTLTTATATLQGFLDQIAALAPAVLVSEPTANTIAGYANLVSTSSALVAVIEAAVPGTGAAYTAYTTAQTAVTTATAAVATAQAALDAAQLLLTSLTATLNGLIDSLQSALLTVLDDTPLVSLGSLSVTTKAAAVTASTGGQTAQVVGGTISGLHVLGTDVLDVALGSSSVDVVDLVGEAASEVSGLVDEITGTLSDVLSNVPSLPTLSIPAPTVELLTKSTSTSIVDGFGKASTAVTGLKITIPAITLPTSVALPGAASLPALTGVTQTAGSLTSAPITLGLGTLTDQAAFRPAVLPGGSTPGSTGQNPNLAGTGFPVGVGMLALVLLGGAFLLRRHQLALDPTA